MKLEDAIKLIKPPDEAARMSAKARWDSIAKPLGSLGLLEDAIIDIAGLTGNPHVTLDKRCAAVFCADNGVVAEGVTQTDSSVTAVVTRNFASGKTSVCAMARCAHCDVMPIDLGVAEDIDCEGLIVHKILHGTGNIAREPAMTREQAIEAIEFGIDFVGKQKSRGYKIIVTGEMGIGNTTTSSAVAAALLMLSPREVTGRGAGLSDEGLSRKISAISRAAVYNHPDDSDPLDVLAKVGGLDIAGITGAFLGGAVHRVPIIIDGFISAVAALLALRICPTSKVAMLASHLSDEPAGKLVMAELGLHPMITAGMRLGEGTGAVALLPLLDMACAVYSEMSTFREAAIKEYKPLSEDF